MIIVLKAGATDTQIDEVAARVRTLGYAPHMIRGEVRTVIGAVGDERGKEDLLSLENFECVETVQRILQPFKLASREISRKRPRSASTASSSEASASSSWPGRARWSRATRCSRLPPR